MANSFNYTPIGIFKSSAVNNYDLPRQPQNQLDEESSVKLHHDSDYIELFKGHNFEQALLDLDGFSRLWVIFQFHKNENWNPMILPPRGSDKKVGVFSSRSPYRPNPIGISCLEIIQIQGLKIFVSSADILAETPILDIKPYIPYCDAFPNSKVGWLENIDQKKYSIEYSPLSQEQLSYLLNHHQLDLYSFINRSLEFEPTNSDKKRLILDQKHPILCYRTWRVEFTLNVESQQVLIQKVFSAYSSTELNSSTDIYQDKKIHTQFLERFDKL
ncbi:MAG: tRNA (N6-threonylcarbamoyladenosine(37)-N6)-methyltransferase TrmO [Bdellovibrionales bacterium]|nr:tRNA (N6-threonylcarbamoyladenosine(37)-N6)-methyltransferase TrmO [Bdellovibrionales bacterium]